jgi:hypothetical protein
VSDRTAALQCSGATAHRPVLTRLVSVACLTFSALGVKITGVDNATYSLTGEAYSTVGKDFAHSNAFRACQPLSTATPLTRARNRAIRSRPEHVHARATRPPAGRRRARYATQRRSSHGHHTRVVAVYSHAPIVVSCSQPTSSRASCTCCDTFNAQLYIHMPSLKCVLTFVLDSRMKYHQSGLHCGKCWLRLGLTIYLPTRHNVCAHALRGSFRVCRQLTEKGIHEVTKSTRSHPAPRLPRVMRAAHRSCSRRVRNRSRPAASVSLRSQSSTLEPSLSKAHVQQSRSYAQQRSAVCLQGRSSHRVGHPGTRRAFEPPMIAKHTKRVISHCCTCGLRRRTTKNCRWCVPSSGLCNDVINREHPPMLLPLFHRISSRSRTTLCGLFCNILCRTLCRADFQPGFTHVNVQKLCNTVHELLSPHTSLMLHTRTVVLLHTSCTRVIRMIPAHCSAAVCKVSCAIWVVAHFDQIVPIWSTRVVLLYHLILPCIQCCMIQLTQQHFNAHVLPSILCDCGMHCPAV